MPTTPTTGQSPISPPASAPLFPLGDLFITRGALRVLHIGQVHDLLRRHQRGDWAELDAEDQRENWFSVPRRLRLFSRYTLATGQRIWVITEGDRTSTTILLPEEY